MTLIDEPSRVKDTILTSLVVDLSIILDRFIIYLHNCMIGSVMCDVKMEKGMENHVTLTGWACCPLSNILFCVTS